MPGEESRRRVNQNPGNSLLLKKVFEGGGMIRTLVWNHAWKCPSQAPAGPEIWNQQSTTQDSRHKWL